VWNLLAASLLLGLPAWTAGQAESGNAVLGCGVAVSVADEPAKEPVRKIDLDGFNAARSADNAPKPVMITNADELAKAIADKDWQAKIAKQVDFNKEQLVFFAWAGSGQDKLSARVDKDKKEPVVVFSYTQGLTDDLRSHFHLYAVGKDATWRVEGVK
jgi:hypothetical protein